MLPLHTQGPSTTVCFHGHIHTTLGYIGKDLAMSYAIYEHKKIASKTLLLATLCCLQLVCCSVDKDCSIPGQAGQEQSTLPFSPLFTQSWGQDCWTVAEAGIGKGTGPLARDCHRHLLILLSIFFSIAKEIFIKSRKGKTLLHYHEFLPIF